MRNIVLIGLPGSGKSSVGRRLAEVLGYPFFDTDEIIENHYETSITDLFQTRGETWFRDAEEAVVARVTRKPRGVLATGGGVVVRESNLARLRQWGWVVALVAPPELLAQRLGSADHLPLVSRENPAASLAHLWAERAPKYLSADLVVDVSSPEVDETVHKILRFLAEREQSPIPVHVPNRPYTVYVGVGTLGLVGHNAAAAGLSGRAALVTTPALDRRYGDVVREALRAAGLRPATFLLPAGEPAKSWSSVGRLYGLLLQEGLDSSSPLFALGGEELGDAAGFVAATYMRGIPLVHLPATLLAQLDSCVGGKVAINHPKAKNLIGAWHHPRFVLIDVSLAAAAGLRSLRAGLAEAVKYAVIADAALLTFLEEQLDAVLQLDPRALSELVIRCLSLKARIVGQDEHETGLRLLLNYGHTFAYAVETATGYRRFSHGEAVAIGMTLAGRMGVTLGVTDPGLLERQTRLLHRIGLPTHFSGVAATRVLEALLHDKKRRGGRLRLVVPCGPGSGQVLEDVPFHLVAKTLGVAPQVI